MRLKNRIVVRPLILLHLLLLRIERIEHRPILLISPNFRRIPQATNREVGLRRRRHVLAREARSAKEELPLRVPVAEGGILLIGIIRAYCH